MLRLAGVDLLFVEGEGDLQLGSILPLSALDGRDLGSLACETVIPVLVGLSSFLVSNVTNDARLVLDLHQFNKERSLSEVESRHNRTG